MRHTQLRLRIYPQPANLHTGSWGCCKALSWLSLQTMTPEPMHATPCRVAVVAVHGIADQRRGDTGQAVALQLAAASAGHVQARDLPLPVAPLDAAQPYQRWKPKGWLERSRKALRQSWRSDFMDDTLGGAPGSGTVCNWAAATAEGPSAARTADRPTADVGVRYTDYLLAKVAAARDPEAPPAPPVSVAVHLVRGPALQADVYEMHWADLSRLPGSVARIVTELFTLMFHLSRLGIDALSLADALAPGGELQTLRRVQRAADWWFTRVLALLGLQLVVCALVLLPALLVATHQRGLRVSLAGLAGVALMGLLVYWRQWRWPGALVVGVLLGLAVWALLAPPLTMPLVMVVWLLALTGLMALFLDYAEQRFRAVWGLGWLFYAATLAMTLQYGWGQDWTQAQTWVQGSLGALEGVLLAHALGWGLFALLLAATVACSEWALRSPGLDGTGLPQTLVTARLGLFTSAGAFLVCQMVAFDLTAWGLKGLLGDMPYYALWFPSSQMVQAGEFLSERASAHAGSFALVSVALLGLLAFVALAFLPSVLRELRLWQPEATRLGRWLSVGYQGVEQIVRVWGWPVGLGAVLVAVALILSQWLRISAGASVEAVAELQQNLAWLFHLDEWVQGVSSNWMGKLVLLAAGGTAGLLALGKVAIRQLQALRGPLDAVLDVDNHFREFPRKAISRVLIIERYVSLLDHLRQQGYTRLVLVAHSQGTVITAELLRYLQQRARLHKPGQGGQATPSGQVDMEQLRLWLDSIELHLMTVGSPLRQLYALRFPSLYPWPVADLADPQKPGWRGPRLGELGVCRWTNLWGTGDYVGRWLWAADTGQQPTPLQVDETRYAGAVVQGQDAQGRRWKDQALGPDAHTHYFDLDQLVVGKELVDLVKG